MKKNCPKKQKNFYLFSMQLFNEDTMIFSFFALENIRKTPSKVAHNRPKLFFQYWPGCLIDPKTEIPYHQKPLNAGLGI